MKKYHKKKPNKKTLTKISKQIKNQKMTRLKPRKREV